MRMEASMDLGMVAGELVLCAGPRLRERLEDPASLVGIDVTDRARLLRESIAGQLYAAWARDEDPTTVRLRGKLLRTRFRAELVTLRIASVSDELCVVLELE